MGDRYLERLLTTTRDELVAVANRYLDPGQRRRDRLSSDVERRRSPRTPRRCARCSTPTPRAGAAAPRRRRTRRTRSPPATRRSFEREEAGVRVYRTAHGTPILVRRKPDAPLVHAGVYVLGGSSDEAPELAGTHDADGAHGAQGNGDAQRAADRRRGRDARRQRRRHRGLGELRLVDLRAGAIRGGGDRAARRRRAASDVRATTRSRPSARSRSPTSSRCATTCIAIRCGSRRRRRSRAIRTACRRAAPRRRCARIDVDAMRAWHRERALASPSVIAHRRRRRSGRARGARGARVRRAPADCAPRSLARADVADADHDDRRAARARADGAGAAVLAVRRATIPIAIRRR